MRELMVDIRQLWTTFPSPEGERVIHENLDLKIEAGEILSLVGGSGTGKTVLLRQILGLEQAARGEIRLLGSPVAALAQKGVAAHIGMLFQYGALFSAFTVLENIAFPLRELKVFPPSFIQEAAMIKLRMVGLDADAADKMPSQLSGGMVKRVALARALIMDPPLLLLDEPTAGLDPESADGLCQLLRGMHRDMGLTVVMVTHDLDTIFELSTRIAVLADRKVIVNGSAQEVLAFEHPFIHEFFLGERGRRAVVALRRRPLDLLTSSTDPKDTSWKTKPTR